MRITVNIDTNEVTTTPASPKFKGGSLAPVEVVFRNSGGVVSPLPDGFSVGVGLTNSGAAIAYVGDLELGAGYVYSGRLNCFGASFLELVSSKSQVPISAEVIWSLGEQRYRSSTFAAIAEKPEIPDVEPGPDPEFYPAPSEIALAIEVLKKDANLGDLSDKAAAFGAIKQAATETATGVVELATQAEVDAGTDPAKAVTPANLKATKDLAAGALQKSANLSDLVNKATAFDTIKQTASESATGVVKIATPAEVNTGTNGVNVVTPATLKGTKDKADGAVQKSSNLSDLVSIPTARANLGAAATTITISAGNGLTGGGDLSGNRSLAIDFTRSNTWKERQLFQWGSKGAGGAALMLGADINLTTVTSGVTKLGSLGFWDYNNNRLDGLLFSSSAADTAVLSIGGGADGDIATRHIQFRCRTSASVPASGGVAGTMDYGGFSINGTFTAGNNIVSNGTASRLPNQAAATPDAIMTKALVDARALDRDVCVRNFVISECATLAGNGGSKSPNEYGSGWIRLLSGTSASGYSAIQFAHYVNNSPGSGAGINYSNPWALEFRLLDVTSLTTFTADTNFVFRVSRLGSWPLVAPPFALNDTGVELRFAGDGAGNVTAKLSSYFSGTLNSGTPFVGGIFSNGELTNYRIDSNGTTITASYRRIGQSSWTVIGSIASPSGLNSSNVHAAVINSGSNPNASSLIVGLDSVKIIDKTF